MGDTKVITSMFSIFRPPDTDMNVSILEQELCQAAIAKASSQDCILDGKVGRAFPANVLGSSLEKAYIFRRSNVLP